MKKHKIALLIFFGVLVSIAVIAWSFYELGYSRGKYSLFEQEGDNKAGNDQAGSSIKVPLFIKPENVKYQSRFLFTYDSPEALHSFKTKFQIDAIAGDGDQLQQAINLLKWVRTLWEISTPQIYPPIDAEIIIDAIKSGRTGGFCAQYNYVFVQALQSIGIKARYVTIISHEVTEVYIEELQRWVLFDPTYALTVKSNQDYISALEIYRNIRHEKYKQMHLEIYLNTIPQEDRVKYLNKYGQLAIWLKNDHKSSPVNFTDIPRYKVYYIETKEEFFSLPPGALYSFYSEDFY